MNLDRLRTDLAGLADEARPVDLRDRAVRTSRRIARTRLALVAAATVAVVGITSAGFALRHDDRALPEIATTPTLSPAPVATLPADATSAIYIGAPVPQSIITEWTPAGLRRIWTAPVENGGPDTDTLTVSPDGTRLSWVTTLGLRVAPLADAALLDSTSGILLESENREEPVVYGGCIWSADSTRVLAGVRNPDELGWIHGWYTIADRSFARTDTGALGFGCGRKVNGDWAAMRDSRKWNEFMTVVWNTRTGERREILDGTSGIEITSVSPDGSRITARIIEPFPQDPVNVDVSWQGNLLIDTRSGETIPLETGGREVRQLFFEPDGDLLARVRDGDHNSLLTYAPDGRLTADDSEPAELLNAILLRLVRT